MPVNPSIGSLNCLFATDKKSVLSVGGQAATCTESAPLYIGQEGLFKRGYFLSLQLDADLWGLVKSNIKNRNKDNKLIENWLDPILYVETNANSTIPRMILGVPTPLHQYFVIENLLEKIYLEVSDLYRLPYEIDVTVTGPRATEGVIPVVQQSSLPELTETTPPIKQTIPTPARPSEFLNPEYTFSTFVVGRNTEFAHAASYNVARNPGQGYNPLFICGPVGMGKTHLLHAVGHQILSTFPQLRINYVSAERFLNECVSAIRRQEMEKFRQKYREKCDILLVDDVQYIGKGEATQEEFFHMLNTFIEKRKQVILASDRMPKDILHLEDRNRSRLEWGLIADISMPDLETRVAILRYKAERLILRVSEDVVNYIARISKRSIRELEGNLKKVKMYSELQGLAIDLDLAKRVLSTHETQTNISLEDIQKLVADHYKVRISDLKSTTRAKQIVVPRQVTMYLIKKHLDKPLVEIGRAFGGKDHTTVMNALERVEFLQRRDLNIKNDIDELTTRIHNITGL
ncbi:MAG: chromosomal replication initiator protein DnaA [Bdellovibrio sp.]|nr:MAG: chromosomal replication initiator protein DnaA [Bdellovibrio sp.]